MLRIGIAASKISKGSLLSYNLSVVLISLFFSLLLFMVGGFSILPIVFIISLIVNVLRPLDFHAVWIHMYKICLIVLAVVVGVLNIVAILKNIQLTKNKI